MERFDFERRPDGKLRWKVPLRAAALLAHPMFNKSSAFSPEERRAFELEGLLPHAVSTMEQMARRAYGHISRKADPLERYIGLVQLQDRNEHLFYRVLMDHLEEFLPIVYTPTVGLASKRYSHIFRRGRGIWITPDHRGRIAQVLRHYRYRSVRLLVVTDNEAILGIGDQGAGGMVIPIGKLAIYSAAAGIHPAETLPVSLDVGTDNRELLAEDLYMGWRQPRLRGRAYDELLAEFVEAVAEVFPGALLQWEDFSKEVAFNLLGRYRERLLSFNDDIQGTGAMTLAGLLAACRAAGSELARQRVVIVGGGAAGIGIALQLRSALAEAGLAGEDLIRAVAVLDSRGLLVEDRPHLDAYKRQLAWPAELVAGQGLGEDRSLPAVVAALHPTALIGTSGQPGLFDRALVTELAGHTERPIIFPLSNPTDNAEAHPGDLLAWTDGRALVATGSPFAPVVHGGREHRIGQGNNAFIFPGIGLGALVAEARQISEGTFAAASRALAREVSAEELSHGQLFPAIHRLRPVTRTIALAVARQVRDEGLAPERTDDELEAALDREIWEPEYPELVPV